MSLRPLCFVRAASALALAFCVASVANAVEKPEIVAAHLGLGGAYKLGSWTPLRVVVQGGEEPLAGQVLAVTPDTDGVKVGAKAPGARPIAIEPGRTTEERMYVRIGQLNAPVDVQLANTSGRTIDQRLFAVGEGDEDEEQAGQALPFPSPATAWLALQLGADSGVTAATPPTVTGGFGVSNQVVDQAEDLPRDAIGYDSFDVVVLAAGSRADAADGGWLGGVAPDDPRIEALAAWVEGGGRLVVSCGAGGATLLAPGGALADFAPGEFAGPSSLSVATPIESYAESDAGPIRLGDGALPISKLTGVNGSVEAFAGRSAEETPLIVRTPRGFGEITFVACDLDHPAIAGWEGREALVKNLLRPPSSVEEANQYGAYPAQQDLVNQIVERLDAAFTGVKTAPFLLIVGLVLLYLLLIGPGDYFFVKNVLKRVEATWVTFPLIVIATSAAAYAGAYWLKGDKLRVNQVELIDVDSESGETRGVLLTHLFSPNAARYDLTLEARSLRGEALPLESSWTGWLGKTGGGLGGMQASGSSASLSKRPDYYIDPTPALTPGVPNVTGLPIQVWSTKTLVSRYQGATSRVVEPNLVPDGEGLIEGSVTNDTGIKLSDCRVLYGSWSWRLGALGDGETATIDPSLSPIRIKKLLGVNPKEGTVYSYKSETIDLYADLMTFGSLASTAEGSASRYLHDLDLTHHLEAGRALLVARIQGRLVSELLRDGEPLVEDSVETEEGPSRKTWVYARFVLPVQEE